MCGYVNMHAGAYRGQKVDLQMIVCCPLWVRGTELWSSGSAIHALNH